MKLFLNFLFSIISLYAFPSFPSSLRAIAPLPLPIPLFENEAVIVDFTDSCTAEERFTFSPPFPEFDVDLSLILFNPIDYPYSALMILNIFLVTSLISTAVKSIPFLENSLIKSSIFFPEGSPYG